MVLLLRLQCDLEILYYSRTVVLIVSLPSPLSDCSDFCCSHLEYSFKTNLPTTAQLSTGCFHRQVIPSLCVSYSWQQIESVPYIAYFETVTKILVLRTNSMFCHARHAKSLSPGFFVCSFSRSSLSPGQDSFDGFHSKVQDQWND